MNIGNQSSTTLSIVLFNRLLANVYHSANWSLSRKLIDKTKSFIGDSVNDTVVIHVEYEYR
jgi:hypothetical protein